MFDVSENEGFELIKVGEYEAYVSEVTPPSNINGKMVSNLSYKIREDVEQEFKGREIKFDYFSDADNMKWKISALAKALGFFEDDNYSKTVNGVKRLNFNSFEEFIQACLNKPIRINVNQSAYVNKSGDEKEKNGVEKYLPATVKEFTPPVETVLEETNSEDLNELPF